MTASHSSCQIRSYPAQYMHLSDGLLYAPKTPTNGKRGWHFGLPIDDTSLLLFHRSRTNIPTIYDASRLIPCEHVSRRLLEDAVCPNSTHLEPDH
ncbi:hypothetical protein N7536_000488 [Penicillium majusculum]|nr:hypothetical protein N7536_000488 [Penicillium majusculum]